MNSLANTQFVWTNLNLYVRAQNSSPNNKPLNNYLGQYYPKKSNRKEQGRWHTSVKWTINRQATSTTNDEGGENWLCMLVVAVHWKGVSGRCNFRRCCCHEFWSVAASTAHAFSFFDGGGVSGCADGGHEGWVLVAATDCASVAVRTATVVCHLMIGSKKSRNNSCLSPAIVLNQ